MYVLGCISIDRLLSHHVNGTPARTASEGQRVLCGALQHSPNRNKSGRKQANTANLHAYVISFSITLHVRSVCHSFFLTFLDTNNRKVNEHESVL